MTITSSRFSASAVLGNPRTFRAQGNSQRAQVLGHVAERSDQLGVAELAGCRITRSAERDCAGDPSFARQSFRFHHTLWLRPVRCRRRKGRTAKRHSRSLQTAASSFRSRVGGSRPRA